MTSPDLFRVGVVDNHQFGKPHHLLLIYVYNKLSQVFHNLSTSLSLYRLSFFLGFFKFSLFFDKIVIICSTMPKKTYWTSVNSYSFLSCKFRRIVLLFGPTNQTISISRNWSVTVKDISNSRKRSLFASSFDIITVRNHF